MTYKEKELVRDVPDQSALEETAEEEEEEEEEEKAGAYRQTVWFGSPETIHVYDQSVFWC